MFSFLNVRNSIVLFFSGDFQRISIDLRRCVARWIVNGWAHMPWNIIFLVYVCIVKRLRWLSFILVNVFTLVDVVMVVIIV